MNSNADSEDVLRVGGFYMLLDLTLTDEQSVCNEFLNNGIRKDRLRCVDGLVQRCFPQSFFRLAGSTSTKSSLFLTSRGNELKLVMYDISNINNAESACIRLL